jgi:hypothetical protein
LPHPARPPARLQLLGVLRGALALQNPRLADPALSCMHKLVAYAYLQGETTTSGRMDDEANFVTQVGAALSWTSEQSKERCWTVLLGWFGGLVCVQDSGSDLHSGLSKQVASTGTWQHLTWSCRFCPLQLRLAGCLSRCRWWG